MMRARLATRIGLLAASIIAGPPRDSTAQDNVPVHDFRTLGAPPEIHAWESSELLDGFLFLGFAELFVLGAVASHEDSP